VADDGSGGPPTAPAGIPPTPDPATPDPATPDPATPDPATPDPATQDPATQDPAAPDPPAPVRLRHRIPFYGGRPRRLRRWPRRILIVANLLVFVVIAAAATVVGYGSYEINTIHRVKVGGLQQITPTTDPASKGKGSVKVKASIAPFTMLIVGSDTRALPGGVGVHIGTTTTNPEDLSDSIILARVDPGLHKLALLSIPRDLYVSIPGLGVQKINAAFAGNDASRLVKVITDDLKIPINHYAAVNFYTFEQIADAIGGVPQFFPSPAYDPESNLVVSKTGCVNLKGGQALAFVRSRNYFYTIDGVSHVQLAPESDLGRIQRQQAFIKSAIRKTERTGDLTNPVKLPRLIGSITKNLSVDNEFSDSQLINLAEDFSNIDADTIPNLTYPVVNSGAGLAGVPAADAATIKKFENFGVVTKKKKAKKATTSTSTTSTTTSASAYGTPYSSGTKVIASSSSFYEGVYIPPGRVPGQVVQTCGA
jgi:LCP family protein required for cell wall assembly